MSRLGAAARRGLPRMVDRLSFGARGYFPTKVFTALAPSYCFPPAPSNRRADPYVVEDFLCVEVGVMASGPPSAPNWTGLANFFPTLGAVPRNKGTHVVFPSWHFSRPVRSGRLKAGAIGARRCAARGRGKPLTILSSGSGALIGPCAGKRLPQIGCLATSNEGPAARAFYVHGEVWPAARPCLMDLFFPRRARSGTSAAPHFP